MTDNLLQQCDLHVHTRLSPCASDAMQVPAIIETCEQRGVRFLGITDHIATSTDPAILREARLEIERYAGPVKVFLGCEADILSVGRHVVTDEIRSAVDFIAVAANHFNVATVEQPPGQSLEAVGRHYLSMFKYACSLEFADVVVHPMTVIVPTYDPTCLDLLTDDDLMEAIELARLNHIAMEISPRSLVQDQMYFRLRFLSLCKRAGLEFSIGSDSHRLGGLGRTGMLASIVNEIGIADSDIWLPNDEFKGGIK